MNAEIVAIGTELLLGQIVDTNSTWIADQLAASGVGCIQQTRVGDNVGRIADVLRSALERSDAVICCGGLGPTQDDVTREAIALVMSVDLVEDDDALARLQKVFTDRNRAMSPSNRQQAEVPRGARLIPQVLGTAPGLICAVGEKVIYALPGVPSELREMVSRAVLPDLLDRSGDRSVIASRVIRTWGLGESRLSEIVAPRLQALDGAGDNAPTIAFLARGIEGVQLRVTVHAKSSADADAILDREEAGLRGLLGANVFASGDETMESHIGALLLERHMTLAVAESFTGGLIASRIVAVPGASRWFRGGLVAYASDVKRALLGIESDDVVSAPAAQAMASGVRRVLTADVSIATTGVAGPDPQEGHAPGVAFVGFDIEGLGAGSFELNLFGDRTRMRDTGSVSALDGLRRRLEGST